ncbi:hypothetical protein BG004_007661 [Podila humilis]|nr:hypothetical protein BG004_007661 [Podila humilis]
MPTQKHSRHTHPPPLPPPFPASASSSEQREVLSNKSRLLPTHLTHSRPVPNPYPGSIAYTGIPGDADPDDFLTACHEAVGPSNGIQYRTEDNGTQSVFIYYTIPQEFEDRVDAYLDRITSTLIPFENQQYRPFRDSTPRKQTSKSNVEADTDTTGEFYQYFRSSDKLIRIQATPNPSTGQLRPLRIACIPGVVLDVVYEHRDTHSSRKSSQTSYGSTKPMFKTGAILASNNKISTPNSALDNPDLWTDQKSLNAYLLQVSAKLKDKMLQEHDNKQKHDTNGSDPDLNRQAHSDLISKYVAEIQDEEVKIAQLEMVMDKFARMSTASKNVKAVAESSQGVVPGDKACKTSSLNEATTRNGRRLSQPDIVVPHNAKNNQPLTFSPSQSKSPIEEPLVLQETNIPVPSSLNDTEPITKKTLPWNTNNTEQLQPHATAGQETRKQLTSSKEPIELMGTLPEAPEMDFKGSGLNKDDKGTGRVELAGEDMTMKVANVQEPMVAEGIAATAAIKAAIKEIKSPEEIESEIKELNDFKFNFEIAKDGLVNTTHLFQVFIQASSKGHLTIADRIGLQLNRQLEDLETKLDMGSQLRPQFAQLCKALADTQRSLQQIREPLIQNRIYLILSQKLGMLEHTYPRAFVILPSTDDPSCTDYRIHFLCECQDYSEVPNSCGVPRHLHLTNAEGYEVRNLERLVRVFGSYMLDFLNMLKYGVSFEGSVIPPLEAGSPLLAKVNRAMEFVMETCDEDREDARPRIDSLYLHLKPEDRDEPSLGGLRRFILEEGFLFWMCQDHFNQLGFQRAIARLHELCSQCPGYYKDDALGLTHVLIGDRIQAENIYIALEANPSVFDLGLILDWRLTVQDYDRLLQTLHICRIPSVRIFSAESKDKTEEEKKSAESLLATVLQDSSIQRFQLGEFTSQLHKFDLLSQMSILQCTLDLAEWRRNSLSMATVVRDCHKLTSISLYHPPIAQSLVWIKKLMGPEFDSLEHLALDSDTEEALIHFTNGEITAMDLRAPNPKSNYLLLSSQIKNLRVSVIEDHGFQDLRRIIFKNNGLLTLDITCTEQNIIPLFDLTWHLADDHPSISLVRLRLNGKVMIWFEAGHMDHEHDLPKWIFTGLKDITPVVELYVKQQDASHVVSEFKDKDDAEIGTKTGINAVSASTISPSTKLGTGHKAGEKQKAQVENLNDKHQALVKKSENTVTPKTTPLQKQKHEVEGEKDKEKCKEERKGDEDRIWMLNIHVNFLDDPAMSLFAIQVQNCSEFEKPLDFKQMDIKIWKDTGVVDYTTVKEMEVMALFMEKKAHCCIQGDTNQILDCLTLLPTHAIGQLRTLEFLSLTLEPVDEEECLKERTEENVKTAEGSVAVSEVIKAVATDKYRIAGEGRNTPGPEDMQPCCRAYAVDVEPVMIRENGFKGLERLVFAAELERLTFRNMKLTAAMCERLVARVNLKRLVSIAMDIGLEGKHLDRFFARVPDPAKSLLKEIRVTLSDGMEYVLER